MTRQKSLICPKGTDKRYAQMFKVLNTTNNSVTASHKKTNVYLPGILIIHTRKLSNSIYGWILTLSKCCWPQDSKKYLTIGSIMSHFYRVHWEHFLTRPQKEIKDARNALQVSNLGFLVEITNTLRWHDKTMHVRENFDFKLELDVSYATTYIFRSDH